MLRLRFLASRHDGQVSVPECVASAPGRINLIGEHLDYNGGRCLPIAIALGTTAAVRRSADGQHHLRSDGLTWSGAPGVPARGWAAYVVGVLEALGAAEPLDITITSDLPIGAGLSSSAALTCSVALAVDGFLGLGLGRKAIMNAGIRAENEYVGVPTGGMDQAVALFGAAGSALMLDFATGARSLVRLDPEGAGLTWVVVDTQVRHALVDGAYAARRADCQAAATGLGLPLLALADPGDLARVPGGRIGRRARHVISEQARVGDFAAACSAGDWAAAGGVMTESHTSLRDDYEVSCAELDAAVGAATDAGALGARMTGGGFGGCAIALVPTTGVSGVEASVLAAFAENGWDAPTVFVVEASGGAEVLSST